MRAKILKNIVNWRKREKYENGYTILLGLPADLPCMAYLSLEFLKKQNLSNCKEILISFDFSKNYVKKILKKLNYNVPLRIINNQNLKNLFYKYFFVGSPFKYHWLQSINGLNNCKTKWMVLKGCNYYVNDKNFYEKIYQKAKKSQAILIGTETRLIKKIKDLPIGTWELFINKDIKKICKPYELLSQNINGINYDNLIYIQNKLKNNLGEFSILKLNKKPNKIHFFYLIGAYRTLIKTKSKNDAWLRLFTLTLMNDLLKDTIWHRKDFITIEKYFDKYSQNIVDDVKKNINKFFKDIMWVVKNRNFNENRVKEIISILKKRI
jgi:hypothetical protein